MMSAAVLRLQPALPRAAAVDPRTVVGVLEPDMLSAVGVFAPSFASPCWRRGEGQGLACLPAFHILSPHQAGAKSLYAALTGHPGIAAEHDPHTQARRAATQRRAATGQRPRFWSGEHMSMAEYVAAFDGSARRAAARPGLLLGDASEQSLTFYFAQNMRGHRRWSARVPRCVDGCAANHTEPGAPGMRGCLDACWREGKRVHIESARAAGAPDREALSVPLLMRAAYGDAPPRLVVLLREPSERLHSAFYEYPQYKDRYGDSPEGYTKFVEDQIGALERCVAKQRRGPDPQLGGGGGRRGGGGGLPEAAAVRRCVLLFESLGYDDEQVFFHADQVLRGLYALYLEQWLALWPRGRVLLLLSEEWFERPRDALARVASFLGLPGDVARDDALWARLRRAAVHRPPNGSTRAAPAAAARRADAFYAPFNRRLGRLMGLGAGG
ncbi:MAG: P-loop containing nucleoside triphosphate hydrolase protein [Monoraphidium minutum]|nr:MAG: P-loop containing nucleoside triphosphate hydrolase protein [Monoraphidium minutum]